MGSILGRKSWAAVAVVLFGASQAMAQGETDLEDEFALLQEEELVYSSAKHEQDIYESPSAITVISREQIENTDCIDLACLLRQVPEVEVIQISALNVAIGARALSITNDRALVLLDGREINVDSIGVPLVQALPVAVEDIDRIEVIRGPGSALYGPNAHSMVVSITTRRPDENHGEVFLGAGEHGDLKLDGRVGFALGAWKLQLSGGSQTEGHWQIRDQQERMVGRARILVTRDQDTSHSFIDMGMVSLSGLLDTTAAPLEIINGLSGYVMLAHRADFWKAQLVFDALDTDLFLDMPLIYQGQKLGTLPPVIELLSTTTYPQVEFTFHPFQDNLLVTGLDYRWIYILSNHNDPNEINQHRLGVFLHDEQRLWNALILTAGVRFDYNSISPFTISPRLALVWRVNETNTTRLAFGQAFRKANFINSGLHITEVKPEPGFPEIEDLFREGIGNEHLQNEDIKVLETGYIGRFWDGKVVFEADAYYNRYRNAINIQMNLVTTPLGFLDLSKSSMQFANSGNDMDCLGGSIALTFRPVNNWRVSINYSYHYLWLVSEPTAEGKQIGTRRGDQILAEPAHQGNFSLSHISSSGFRFGGLIHGQSSMQQGIAKDGNHFNSLFLAKNPGALYLNGFVAWRLNLAPGWFEIGMKVFDLFNVGFRDRPAVSRQDGTEMGGVLMGRKMFLYVRGCL